MRPVLLFSLVLSLSACDGSSSAPAASKAPEELPKPVPTEIEEDAVNLPPGFVSADITELFVKLRDSGKSEFETTQAYKKRLGEEARTYSFLVEAMETNYDADHGQMVARLRLKVDASTGEEDSLMVPILHRVERSNFLASNAVGVNVEVQRTAEIDYGMAVVKIPATVVGNRRCINTTNGSSTCACRCHPTRRVNARVRCAS